MAATNHPINKDSSKICKECKEVLIPSHRSQYCSAECLRSATRKKSKIHKRAYRKNGDIHHDDHWVKVGFDAKREYFRNYMRAYRASNDSSNCDNSTLQSDI